MNENITINYGLQSPFQRWWREFWTKSDRDRLPWIAVFLLGLAVVYGPQWLLQVASLLPIEELGNSGASIRAHIVILTIALALTLVALFVLFRRLMQPAAICLDQSGVKKVWHFFFFDIAGRTLQWSQITSITLQRPEETTDLRKYLLCFSGTTPEKKFVISLGQIDEQKEDDNRREQVLEGISRFSHNAVVEPAVVDILAPKRSLDFTEIWLNALSAPPGRDRLLPIDDGALLNERYRITRRLGAGGQGTVYLAQDTQNADENVVLKETILPVYADLLVRKQALASFHKEALSLESLSHEHIVKFKRSFVCDHRAYLVLQYIDGATLSQKIKKGGVLAPELAIKYASQITDILQALHQSSPPLVHRDLTPDNLMLKDDDNLVLIDFAIAVSSASKLNDGEESSSDVAGKAAYMAPEQFQGKPVIQSDIYSLGGVLFFMLTGDHPEPLTSSAPLLINHSISEDLNCLVMKTTSYQAKDRFASAADLKQALLRLS
jgi:tRNA A-37 threonylcarbamoyl transferase component Bud32